MLCGSTDSNSQAVYPRFSRFWLDLCGRVAAVERDSHLVSVRLKSMVFELLVYQKVSLVGLCILGLCLYFEHRFRESRRSGLLAFLNQICEVSELDWFSLGIFMSKSVLAPPFLEFFAGCMQVVFLMLC